MSLQRKCLLGLIALSQIFACSSGSKKQRAPESRPQALIRSDFTPAELKTLCEAEIKTFSDRLNRLSQLPPTPASFAGTFGELENAGAEFQENMAPLTFMFSVSTNPELRQVSQECESQSSQAAIEVFSRKDLYNVMKNAQKNLKASDMDAADQRLISETMRAFKLAGLELPDDKLEKFKNMKKEMADLSSQFHGNLNNNVDVAEMTEAEMAGVPDSVKSRFKKLPNGNYQIPAKGTFYVAFMENASNADARRKMQSIYDNREAAKNTPLLQKMVRLRRDAARLIGFKDWADYKTYDKMAGNGKTAWDFLQGLKGKLRTSYQKDYQRLFAFKKELDPSATKLNPWDSAYLSNHLRKKLYSIDEEMLREYFPAEHVISKMFDLYSQLFRIKFVPVSQPVVWYSTVKLFEVRDAQSNELLAHFYADLYPRDGKYNHAAAFPLRAGRQINGSYHTPVAAIVANLSPPTADKPSLLSHDDVETLFHEFGHIMHMTLTRVKYASLSGASVAWDFVEAPSQVLENWVWEPEVLRSLTAHYADPSQKMPDAMIQKLVASRKFNQAWMNTRQLVFGIYDLTLHRSPVDVDVTETYKKIYTELTGLQVLPESHFPATFGHLMGGYDAGYYGYLWSNVYAFDMFTLFEDGHLLSSDVGYKYRVSILEKGNLKDAGQLLQDFLGRKPNSNAFFKFLGL